jgi:hypothetical protein
VFSDRQSVRMERALAKTEFGFGQGGYQPTEFIKRYLPNRQYLEVQNQVLLKYELLFSYLVLSYENCLRQIYKEMSENLGNKMRECLAKGDNSLLGVVMNVLLRWPDTGFNAEMVVHPRTRLVARYKHCRQFA